MFTIPVHQTGPAKPPRTNLHPVKTAKKPERINDRIYANDEESAYTLLYQKLVRDAANREPSYANITSIQKRRSSSLPPLAHSQVPDQDIRYTNLNDYETRVVEQPTSAPQRRSNTSSNTSSEDLPPFPPDVHCVIQPDGYYYYVADSRLSYDENFARANEILEYYGLEPVVMMINDRNRGISEGTVSSMPYLTRYQSPSSSRNTNTLPNQTPPPYGMTPSPVSSGVSMSYDHQHSRGPLVRSRSYGNARYPIDHAGSGVSPVGKSSPVPAAPKEEAKQSGGKKWSFGALFHRKNKNKDAKDSATGTRAANNIRFIPAAELPPHLVRSSMPKLDSNSDDESRRRHLQQLQQLRVPGGNWENTRKYHQQQQQPMVLGGGMAYSSSGSYSTDDVRQSKHRKNAVKARAVARRESFIESSSSEEDCNGSSSLQGSHSSLSSSARQRPSRGRRRPEMTRQYPQMPQQYQQYQQQHQQPQQTLTPSPRWEARVVYTEETLEQEEPVVIRLPRYPQYFDQRPSTGDDDIIREGLQVPFVVGNSATSPFPADDRTYANLPMAEAGYRNGNFYRPMSCSYLDGYNRNVFDVPFGGASSPVPYNIVNVNQFAEQQIPKALQRSPSEPREMRSAEVDTTKLVTPKQGYPVRKLGEVNKLPVTQSPVHMQASEFWRKKEAEVTGVEAAPKGRYRSSENTSTSPSPLKGILRTSPKTKQPMEPTSNESISSLSSSISIDGASPSSSVVDEKRSAPIKRPQSLQAIGRSSSANQIQQRSRSQQSACERLKVAPQSASRHAKEVFSRQVKTGTPSKATPVAAAEPTKKKAADEGIKASGKDLEDALNELEDMYKSLRLSDEDLMDRAERRDLPTVHQQLRDAPPIRLSSALSSYESLDSTIGTPSRTGSSLAASSVFFGSDTNVSCTPRVRAPPLRRSSRPDPEGDDMAKRRLEKTKSCSTTTPDPRQLTGSYMQKSPAFSFSPPATPLPPVDNALVMYSHDPDLTFDDVMFRNYKKANAIRIIDPQPMFGIPLGPTTPAPSSDYLHAQPEEKFRPLFRNTKRPDVVKDDIAFRNLRKDLNKEQNMSNKDWTPRLFDKNHGAFTFEPKPTKKLRAIRSLSANISNLVPFKQSPVNVEIGKWNSFSDLYRQTAPRNHKEPSWVEEIERLQQRASSSETLSAAATATAEPSLPLEGPSARALRKSEEIGKARRPWTDAIFEDLDKEKSVEEPEVESETKPTPKKRSQPPKSTEVQDDQPPSFTPLPPPRKVHQIQLESFVEPQTIRPEVAEVVVVPEEAKREVLDASEAELQLTNLIDALVRDAETCGPEAVPKPTIKGILKKSPEPPVAPADLEDELAQVQDSNVSSDAFVSPVTVLSPNVEKVVDDDVTADVNDSQQTPPPSSVSVANDFKDSSALTRSNSNKTEGHIKSVFRLRMPWMSSATKEKEVFEKSDVENGKDKSSKRKSFLNRTAAEVPENPPKNPNPKPIENKYVKAPSFLKQLNGDHNGRHSGGDSSSSNESPKSRSASAVAANGITCLKKLLLKEATSGPASTKASCEEPKCDSSAGNSPKSWGSIKKSPSVGSTFNWSRWTSNSGGGSQRTSPFFSRKERAPSSEKGSKASSKEDVSGCEDKVLKLSVAQKANFFMKLEHDQRFSRWRSNGVRSEVTTPVGSAPERTMLKEVFKAEPKVTSGTSNVGQKLGPVPWRNPATVAKQRAESVQSTPKDDDYETPLESYGSSTKLGPLMEDTKGGNLKIQNCVTPSSSSRVPSRARQTPFLSGRDSATRYLPQTSGKFTPQFGGRRSTFDEFHTPISWAPWEQNNHHHGRSQEGIESTYATPLSMFKRYGSTPEMESCRGTPMMPTPSCPQHGGGSKSGWSPIKSVNGIGFINRQSPKKLRNNRVKSMILAGTSDADTFSEGEFSSGGQEVADIICKSYENSPMIRKKQAAKSNSLQANTGKTVWKRCFPEPLPPPRDPTNDIFYDASSEFECFTNLPSPPATSNLLHILNVLSSSNDDLEDSPSQQHKQAPPPLTFSQGVATLNTSLPDMTTYHSPFNRHDGSLRSWAGSAEDGQFYSPVPPPIGGASSCCFNDVQREQDMLVLKKDVPPMARKSSTKSRNPLKALAARMDFRFGS